jgi:hypothetical protein
VLIYHLEKIRETELKINVKPEPPPPPKIIEFPGHPGNIELVYLV